MNILRSEETDFGKLAKTIEVKSDNKDDRIQASPGFYMVSQSSNDENCDP